MNGAYVIEIEGETAGIVLVDDSGVQFLAAGPAFWTIDRRTYPTIGAAERAAAEILRLGRPARRGRAGTKPERGAAAA